MMTTSGATTDNLRDVIDAALESGVPRDDLLDMVNIAYLQMAGGPMNLQANGNGRKGLELATDDKDLPIYTELPEGLFDLKSASAKLGCNIHRLRSWVQKGRVEAKGKLRAPARGGGYLLVCLEDVKRELNAPANKGGRPRKRTLHVP